MCDAAGVDEYTRFCTVLTAYAESDFKSSAVQHGTTFDVFQQNPKYWPSALLGVAAQCKAFLFDFAENERHHNGEPVHDCWVTQRWAVPNGNWPDPGEGFRAAPESVNYIRRLPLIPAIIRDRRLP